MTIPNSVQTIGSQAFAGCSGLEKVYFNAENCQDIIYASVPAFPSTLKEVNFGDRVKQIPGNAFRDCNGLTGMTIPNSVQTIGEQAFLGCSGLTEVTIGNSVQTIGRDAFRECRGLTGVTIPNSVQTIGDAAFYGCEGLTGVTIPNSVQTIGDEAFYNCSGLTEVIIPKSVETIGNEAFQKCSGIVKAAYPNTMSDPFPSGIRVVYEPEGTSIEGGIIYGPEKSAIYYASISLDGEYVTPNTVQTIGSRAFYECSRLTEVTIGNSVQTIGDAAFYGCDRLKKAEFASIEKVCSIDFSSYHANPLYYAEHLYIEGAEVTEVKIPDTVEAIGKYAFLLCKGLTEVIIGNSVQTIDDYAFYGCSGLTGVTIGNSVQTIGDCAFYGCSGLTGVTIGNSVQTIGNEAFYGCEGLSAVSVNWITPIALPSNSFSESTYSTAVLSVPENTFIAYAASNWVAFKNIEVGEYSTSELSDGVFLYKVFENPESREAVLIAGDYSSLTEAAIPERFTDDRDAANPIRYYITGIGPNAFKDCTGLKTVKFHSRSKISAIGNWAFSGCEGLTEMEIPEAVITIGDNSFGGCSGLTEVTIGNSVQTIGDQAFYGCCGLTEVIIGNSVQTIGKQAFYNCSSLEKAEFASIEKVCSIEFGDYYANPLCYAEHLYIEGAEVTEVKIPNTMEAIGNYAFYNCSGLTEVTIPNSVQTIGDAAFRGCNGLKDFIIEDGDSELIVGENALNSDIKNLTIGRDWSYSLKEAISSSIISVTLTQSVTKLPAYAFNSCRNLKQVTIPNSVQTIGDYAFEGCSGLTKVTIGNSVQTIGRDAFRECRGLTGVTIPSSVQTIDEYAFRDCSGLTEVTIPNSVQTIGKQAFYNCSGLTEVTLLDGAEPIEWGTGVFGNTNIESLYIGRSFEDQVFPTSKLTTLTFGNNLTEISGRVWNNNPNLSELTLGASMTDIIDEAFSGCTALTEVILPPSVETIGASAFAGNTALSTIIMGHNVKEIGEKAFDGCAAEKISITAQTPPTAPNNTFSNYSGKLYLQDPGDNSVIDAYYDAYTCWDRFDSYVMIAPEKMEGDIDKVFSGKAGDQIQLTATMWPQNVTLPQIFWRSTNPDIATVDENGLVTLMVDLDNLFSRAGGDEEGEDDLSCKIIAESLYANGPALEYTVVDPTGGIEDIMIPDGGEDPAGEIDYTRAYEVYNLNGIRVGTSTEGLAKGLYIIRQGKTVKKIVVR